VQEENRAASWKIGMMEYWNIGQYPKSEIRNPKLPGGLQ